MARGALSESGAGRKRPAGSICSPWGQPRSAAGGAPLARPQGALFPGPAGLLGPAERRPAARHATARNSRFIPSGRAKGAGDKGFPQAPQPGCVCQPKVEGTESLVGSSRLLRPGPNLPGTPLPAPADCPRGLHARPGKVSRCPAPCSLLRAGNSPSWWGGGSFLGTVSPQPRQGLPSPGPQPGAPSSGRDAQTVRKPMSSRPPGACLGAGTWGVPPGAMYHRPILTLCVASGHHLLGDQNRSFSVRGLCVCPSWLPLPRFSFPLGTGVLGKKASAPGLALLPPPSTSTCRPRVPLRARAARLVCGTLHGEVCARKAPKQLFSPGVRAPPGERPVGTRQVPPRPCGLRVKIWSPLLGWT